MQPARWSPCFSNGLGDRQHLEGGCEGEGDLPFQQLSNTKQAGRKPASMKPDGWGTRRRAAVLQVPCLALHHCSHLGAQEPNRRP